MMASLRWMVPPLVLWGAATVDLARMPAGMDVPVALPAAVMALVVSQSAAAAVAWAGLGGLLLDCGAGGRVGPNMALGATTAWALHALVPGVLRRPAAWQALAAAALWLLFHAAGPGLVGARGSGGLRSRFVPSGLELAIGLATILAVLFVSQRLGSDDLHNARGEPIR